MDGCGIDLRVVEPIATPGGVGVQRRADVDAEAGGDCLRHGGKGAHVVERAFGSLAGSEPTIERKAMRRQIENAAVLIELRQRTREKARERIRSQMGHATRCHSVFT